MRFVGNTGYVVTFRQIDPLYTLDLADPAQPRVLGELEIAGYSAYLHPIGDDLMIGIGQDADTAGHLLGTQISLFDVSDLAHPKLLAARPARPGLVGGGVRPPRVPLLAEDRPRSSCRSCEQARRLPRRPRDRDRRARPHRARRGSAPATTPPIRRSLVVGGSLFTVSDAGVESSSLGTLAAQGWAAFPPVAPPVVPPSG